jgi:hypothetical protein
MTHSELESLISAEGREIHRRLLQGHLDLRASEERIQASVQGAEDVERQSSDLADQRREHHADRKCLHGQMDLGDAVGEWTLREARS